ncbi:MAG: hypothetical protein HOE90_07225 [Bacteriovoracaceae bacterium]|jgi:hypothetical protein|nr:hypothetical protein [Bacteriovoracaceae bacterium]
MKILNTILLIFCLISCSHSEIINSDLSGDELFAHGKKAAAKKDVRNAKSYFQAACDKGQMKACYELAGFFKNYEDRWYVAQLLEKSCRGGVVKACPGTNKTYKKVQQRDPIEKAKKPVRVEAFGQAVKHIFYDRSQKKKK